MPPSPTTNQSPNSALPVLAKSKDMFNLNKSDQKSILNKNKYRKKTTPMGYGGGILAKIITFFLSFLDY